jgi:hypothetical protein
MQLRYKSAGSGKNLGLVEGGRGHRLRIGAHHKTGAGPGVVI